LSGGEMGAAVIVEAVMRLLPGAVGNEASTRQESFTVDANAKIASGADSTCGSDGLLDYPHYTRPAEFRGIVVPDALMSGNHEEIRKWRRQRALEKTFRNRPDLLEGAVLSKEDEKFLSRMKIGGINLSKD
jgi:tRNA (guanine37-N1)-methyltransferase